MNLPADLASAIQRVAPGAWAVACSGGADSVALLHLLTNRTDLRLHAVHLDHQTRQGQSTRDGEFVQGLCNTLQVPLTLARRDQIEPLRQDWPANTQARYRALRRYLFAQTVEKHSLQGVILAHHRDDQAETILQRLERGGGMGTLVGMQWEKSIGSLRMARPLLEVPGQRLRQWLAQHHLPWREDASNQSLQYQRNRARVSLRHRPQLAEALVSLSQAAAAWERWLGQSAPRLLESFSIEQLANLPEMLARAAARRWLEDGGCSKQRIDEAAVNRLLHMASDAACAHQQHFPGGILVRRKTGRIERVDEGT